jgi:hypothetical protein
MIHLQQHTSKQCQTCGTVGIPCHGDSASSASTPHVWRWSMPNFKQLRSTPQCTAASAPCFDALYMEQH